MNRPTARFFMAGLLALAMACPIWAQKGGAPAPPSSSSGSSSSGNSGACPDGSIPNPGQSCVNQMPTPLYVSGRVLMDSGQPVPEPVTIEMVCSTRSIEAVHTDLKGYFEFTLGGGASTGTDLSASDDGDDVSLSGGSAKLPSGFGGVTGNLIGCELQASVSGYRPLSHIISDITDLSRVDVGTLELTRIAGVAGTSISVTSMLVPNNARKEFEQGDKDARDNKMKSATQHLEKAVAEYDNYAAAWNDLGKIYSMDKDTEKARQAFQKAIATDAKYVPPYMNLATLQLQNKEYQDATDTAGKALDLDSSLVVADFIQAVGYFNLHQLDAAEKSGLAAEKEPHRDTPQLHALLSDLYLQQHNLAKAAPQMRAYLKEWPKGPFADEMKQNLAKIEAATADDPTLSAAVQVTAP
jgi:hypothetical protein